MYYTLEKTAEILELTPGEVNRLRESNKLRAFRDGASWKFRKEDVEKYLTDLIRERSKPAAELAPSDLLNDSDEEELPTMLADSASFDAMIDATAETLEIKTNAPTEDEFALELPTEDDLQIVDEPQIEEAPVLETQADDLALPTEDDDFSLELADEPAVEAAAPEADFAPELSLDAEDDLLLVDEAPAVETAPAPEADFAPEAAVDDDLLLVDDEQADEESASVFSLESDDANALDGGSDDNLLHLGSDSGLSLLDDVDLSGSNVSLDGDDVVLGGSGSGSGLSLGGDSGLSLLDEDADDFALASGPAEESSFAPEIDEDDDSIFELADEPKPSAVLELEQDADPDTATVLGTGEDFQLEADSTTYEVSESESASQIIDVADDA
ncbi:MAG: helix-turn-helix domain-containing protein, partial [Thermoguttaceae bacterium]|nr:helix-turn-helix domain-containing protein [Thermoguttaceae bacterium]